MSRLPTIKRLSRDDYPDQPWIGKLLQPINDFMDGAYKALNHGATFGENLQASLKTFEITPKTDWQAPTLLNGWLKYPDDNRPAPSYRKVGDVVQLIGRIASGTVGSGDNAVIFQIPAAYRPAKSLEFPCDSNTAYGRLAVTYTGNVICTNGNNTYVSLDGIAFPASDPLPIPNAAFPIKVANDLKTTPSAVWVWRIRDVTIGQKPQPLAAASTLDWHLEGDQIVVDSITGLTYGRTYSVTIVSIGG